MTSERLKAGAKYALPKVNGKTLDLNRNTPTDSTYMERKEGSGIVTLIYCSRKWDYDFEKN